MTKDEALQLALETLKFFPSPIFISDKHKLDDAIEVIKEALETKDEKWGSSSITNPEFVAEQKEKTQQLRNMVDAQNMASKSTYKEQLETKDEPVAWMNRHGACKTSLFMELEAGAKEEYTIPVYTTPQRTWVGLKDDDEIPWDGVDAKSFAKAIEAKLKEKNFI